VRGTDLERPISGDSGLSATFELSTPELLPGLRLLGFVEGGYLWNNDPTTPGKPSSDRLASVGVGLRFFKGNFSAAFDYGYLVEGSKVPLSLNSGAPQTGDDRFYINLGLRF